MSSHSDADIEYADHIMSLLLNNQSVSGKLEENLVISDIEKEVAGFLSDLDLLNNVEHGVPVLALENEELVPVSLDLIFGVSEGLFNFLRYWRVFPLISFLNYSRIELRSLFAERLESFEIISHEKALSIFKKRSTGFLATRIATIRKLRQSVESYDNSGFSLLFMSQFLLGSHVSTPGCNFTVTTNSQGLRVFWSGAYRVSANYFSHPTTPASSVLQSGNYVFGVDGGAYGNTIQWDTNAVVSLPGRASVHLNY